ncbi:MAG: hypothetical protein II251_05765 [Lachnospiraceae bacterium]|nr:hypothetical protein [Lachnospiraceae bacterium]
MKEKMKINKENACILILIGILCLVVVWPTSKKDSKSSAETLLDNTGTRMEDETDMDTSLNLYIENQEVRLKNILSQIEGAGEVQVMIRASASKAYIVEKDMTTNSSSVYETDAEGGTRKSDEKQRTEASLYTKDHNGNDVPWIVKEMEPEIEGVLIAAQGGDQNQVAGEITQAVQVLFDIPVHKIKVVKMKDQ